MRDSVRNVLPLIACASLLAAPSVVDAGGPGTMPMIRVTVTFKGGVTDSLLNRPSFDDAKYSKWCRDDAPDSSQRKIAAEIAQGLEDDLLLYRFTASPTAPAVAELVVAFQYHSSITPAKVFVTLVRGTDRRERPLGEILENQLTNVCGRPDDRGKDTVFAGFVVDQAKQIHRELLASVPVGVGQHLNPECVDCERPYLNTSLELSAVQADKLRRMQERGEQLMLQATWTIRPKGQYFLQFIHCPESGAEGVFRGPIVGAEGRDGAARLAADRSIARACEAVWTPGELLAGILKVIAAISVPTDIYLLRR